MAEEGRLGTVIRYLLGDRQAILDLAARPRLGIGLLLVLAAGVARELDAGNPAWHVLVPAAVSLVASWALWCVAYCGLAPPGPPLFDAYRRFLGLFWFTAPMAWLYAIPFHRFLGPTGATAADLLTLGAVSLWRVALMARVLVVLMGYRPLHAFAVVMAFADVVVLVAMFFVPVPLIEFMSGAQRTESERLLQSVASTVCTVGVLSLPVWIVAAARPLRRKAGAWQGQG